MFIVLKNQIDMSMKNFLLGIICCLLVASCNEDRLDLGKIDVPNWNKQTVDFAFENCDLLKNEYNKDSMPPAIDSKGNPISIKEDLESILKKREIFLQALMKSDIVSKLNSKFIIEEWYNKPIKENSIVASYDIHSDMDSLYSFRFYSNDEIKLKVLTKQDPSELRLFNNEECVNDLIIGAMLDEITIKTNFNIADKNSKILSQVDYMVFNNSSH